ncbi:hypothetical protein GCM10023189_16440 [Nibrella saemangeumensis]|uniref:DUF4199 domain-containing protein n=1 Tax=Nibrella saemangeumensis TaxID=1084526 RepID=A0ABP8MNV7_9BACT
MNRVTNYFNTPLLKVPLLAGLTTGVLAFLYFLALYALGVYPLGNHKSLDFGIHIIMMIAAVWYYRKYVGNGYLHLWEALGICYILNTVAAMVTGWLIYFFVTQVDPSVFQEYLANSRQLLLNGQADISKTLGADQFENLLKDVRNTKPTDLIVDELWKKTALAVLPVLIISLLFRRQDYNVLR